MMLRLWIFLLCISTAVVQLIFPQSSLDALKASEEPKECAFCCNAQDSAAEVPFYAFEGDDGQMPAGTSQRWHREYERNGDYGESWFFLVNTHQGGILFANISIINLGLRTFDSALDVRFYASDGEVFKFHQDYQRNDIAASGDGLDLTIGNNRLKADGNTYRLSINQAQLQLDLTLEKTLPAYRFGDGRLWFYEDRSAEWSIHFDAPRADASGTLTAGDKMFNLAGTGFHNHTWSTIKLPAFMQKWYNLRLSQGRFSIILHQIQLTPKFGGGLLCAGLIGHGDRLIPTRSFLLKPRQWREDTSSGIAIPTEWQLMIEAENISISGVIREAQFLDAIDILGHFAWPIRQLVKSFYTKPFLIRYRTQYDLVVTDTKGTRHQLSGWGLAGINSY